MHFVHLAEYIRHGMFLKNIAEHNRFDAIIYESLSESKVALPENLTIHTLDTNNTQDSNAQLMAYADHYEHILVILDSLHLHALVPFLEHIQTNKQNGTTTLVNLTTGASGIVQKGTAELHDIGMSMEYGISPYEAYDFVHFFHLLNQHTENFAYIRLVEGEYPGTLLPELSPLGKGMQDLSLHGLTGPHATILCAGYHATACIQAYALLQEANHPCDIFLMVEYGLSCDNQALIASLEKTKKLILILDQSSLSSYRYYLQSWLFEQGIHDLISIQIITPDMTDITMSPSLTLYEQVGFSATSIAEQILET